MIPPERFARRLLVLSPAWPLAALCLLAPPNAERRYWLAAAAVFAALGAASLAAAARPAGTVAGWLPAAWRAVTVPAAGWGLLMLPTVWFTCQGVFWLIVAAFLIGYAKDLSAAVRHAAGAPPR